LADWSKAQPGFLCDASLPSEFQRVGDISTTFPDWVSDTRNVADPWIIAHAEATGQMLVTDERLRPAAAPQNLTIPTVIVRMSLTVAYCDFNDFQRAEGWKFVRA